MSNRLVASLPDKKKIKKKKPKVKKKRMLRQVLTVEIVFVKVQDCLLDFFISRLQQALVLSLFKQK